MFIKKYFAPDKKHSNPDFKKITMNFKKASNSPKKLEIQGNDLPVHKKIFNYDQITTG